MTKPDHAEALADIDTYLPPEVAAAIRHRVATTTGGMDPDKSVLIGQTLRLVDRLGDLEAIRADRERIQGERDHALRLLAEATGLPTGARMWGMDDAEPGEEVEQVYDQFDQRWQRHYVIEQIGGETERVSLWVRQRWILAKWRTLPFSTQEAWSQVRPWGPLSDVPHQA
jgi:hypothetical protein